MVSEGKISHVSRLSPLEGAALCDGPRIPALVEPEGLEIEIINLHVTRARIKPGIWPRHHELEYLPESTRVVVETPDGIKCPVKVSYLVLDGFIYASGHQDGVCRGADVMAGGEFPRKCELEAESRALAML